MFTMLVGERRKQLFDFIEKLVDYQGFTRADIVEAGLDMIITNSQLAKDEKKIGYPSIDDYESWQEFLKTCTEPEYKLVVSSLERLLNLFNKKWETMG